MRRTGDGIFVDAQSRREETGDEIGLAAASGGDDEFIADLFQSPELRVRSRAQPLRLRAAATGRGSGALRGSSLRRALPRYRQVLPQAPVASSENPARSSRPRVAHAADRSSDETPASRCIAELVEHHPGRGQGRVSAEVDLRRRGEPADVVLPAAPAGRR